MCFDLAVRLLLMVCGCVLFNTACSSHVDILNSTKFDVSPVNCELLEVSKVLTPDNPVKCDRLRKVSFEHHGEDNKTHQGSFIVLDVIAPKVRDLMYELYGRGFVIAKAIPVREYGGDDYASMADNNSSGFNGRRIAGDIRWSMHAYGAAIDINPVQNPFIELNENGTAVIKPAASARYSVNRLDNRPNKEQREGLAESVVDIFARYGFFVWGGDWNYPIDYQHFQIGTRSFIEQLAKSSVDEGERQIQRSIDLYVNCSNAIGLNIVKSRKICIEEVTSKMKQ